MRHLKLVSPGIISAALLVITLIGCSGESGNVPPQQPDFSDSDLRLGFAGRQLIFEWDPVVDATSYELYENLDGASGFTLLAEVIPSGAAPAAVEVSENEDGTFRVVKDISVHLFDWVDARFRLESCVGEDCTVVDDTGAPGLSFAAIQRVKTSASISANYGYSVALSEDTAALAGGAIGESTAIFLQDGSPAAFCDEDDTPVVSELDEEGNTVFFFEDGSPVDPEAVIANCPLTQSSGTVFVFDLESDEETSIDLIKATNLEAFDAFGVATAISDDGNLLVASATGEDSSLIDDQEDNEAESAGAAYIFQRDSEGNWPLPGEGAVYIKASNPDEADFFGSALALSGDGTRLAVAAVGEASAATGVNGDQANNDAGDAGAVYIFANAGEGWAQEAYIKASNTDADDLFGFSLDLNRTGDVLVVGAPGESAANDTDQSSNSKRGSGAVYVFERSGAVWTQQAYLKASNADPSRHAGDTIGDSFGTSVSLTADGARLLIGAPNEDSSAIGVDGNKSDNGSRNSGAAYLFARDGDAWDEQTYFKASNTGLLDEFGTTVRLSKTGDSLVVSAQRESSSAVGINGTENIDNLVASGAAYLFVLADNAWRQEAFIKGSVANFGMLFGWEVDIARDGDVLAISAPFEDSLNRDSGAIFVY